MTVGSGELRDDAQGRGVPPQIGDEPKKKEAAW
jgi:hypothetical protein